MTGTEKEVTDPSPLFDAEDKPFGRSYADWSVEWWKWWCDESKEPREGKQDVTNNVYFLTTKKNGTI